MRWLKQVLNVVCEAWANVFMLSQKEAVKSKLDYGDGAFVNANGENRIGPITAQLGITSSKGLYDVPLTCSSTCAV
ncbi:hypothetical protein VNO80_17677 [Phaseolus coccineus]|uniref:Uncharacterized protein n=1 Tax=Phaseolus coccineus TaxID=3886 RepID=A0AAN9MHS0_PHACN